jgi:acyl-CoA synthetase (AMP-forming)/AMP-acid ligase II
MADTSTRAGRQTCSALTTIQSPRWRLGHIVHCAAQTAADSTALIVGAERRRITYGELADLVLDQVAALQRVGLRPGDVAGLQARNSIEFVVGLLAATCADIVVAPLDPVLPPSERRRRADMVGARVILTDSAPTSPVGSGRAEPPVRLAVADSADTGRTPVPGLSSDDALVMFTSGTTGIPKMVPWTHANIAASIRGIANAYQLGPSDATVAVMPLFHGHGLIAALLATLATGGRILLPAGGKFSAHGFWEDIATVNATWYTAVPTIHQILLNRAPADLPDGYRGRLRFIRSCSAPLSPDTAQRMEATFNAPVLAAYGMTEATHQASSVRPCDDQRSRLHTVGTPSGLSIRIVDGNGNGNTRPTGATGEIWLAGPAVVRGYLDNPTASASTFVGGWLRTGDLGAVDARGVLTVKGRIKNLINRGGEKISPEHVEDVLASHPGVAQAAVFGIPDALYGEKVAAVIVAGDRLHLDQTELRSYCRDALAPFEIPEQITFADQLPLTAKGSVDRAKLAERFRH